MTKNQTYFYIRMKDTFLQEDTTRLLRHMPNGNEFVLLLLHLYLTSVKFAGMLMIAEKMPHTIETIAALSEFPVETVQRAMVIYEQMGIVEKQKNGVYFMPRVPEMVGMSSTEGERKRRQRTKAQTKETPGDEDICPEDTGTVPPQDTHTNAPSVETEVDKCPTERDICPDNINTNTNLNPNPNPNSVCTPTASTTAGETGAAAPAHTRILGEYGNVSMTPAEYERLRQDFPDKFQTYIDRLSRFIRSSGKKYRHHDATIRRWIDADLEKERQKEASASKTTHKSPGRGAAEGYEGGNWEWL